MTTNVQPGDIAICVSVPATGIQHSLIHLNIGAMCKVLRVSVASGGWTHWEVEALSHWVCVHARHRNHETTVRPGQRLVVSDSNLRALRFTNLKDEVLDWAGYPPSPKLEQQPGRPLAQFSDKALRAIGKRLGFDPQL